MINVVAAIIINDRKEVLIARRNSNKSFGGFWEFPGGKIEKDETSEVALVREIKEELDKEIKVYDLFLKSSYDYDFGTVILYSYLCNMINEVQLEFRSTDHDLVKWEDINRLNEYRFLPADIEIINKLLMEEV